MIATRASGSRTPSYTLGTREERLPGVEASRPLPAVVKEIQHALTPARRVGGEQHAAVEVGEKRHQGRGRIVETRLYPHRRRFAGRGIQHARPLGLRVGAVTQRVAGCEPRADRRRLVKRLPGLQHRTLRVYAADGVAFLNIAPRRREDVLDVRRRSDDGILREVVEEGRRIVEEQRQVVLDPAVSDAVRDLAVDA